MGTLGQIKKALSDAAQTQDVNLVDVEKVGTKAHPIIRVFIDTETGITIDEIVKANSWISTVLDELDLIKGSYDLEVSSPGIDRKKDRKED